ncbi:hypothetical protein C6Q22_04860 [Burkholderia multivorans]|nr:hypothetical protein BURMUCGD1_2779 [Burkholderia multivorans CGD1]PRF42380.1 hypothetical protein C6Q10_08440 [Burkholderia multivorans]PRF92914.1 hypothetical protein C6Q22_04860 [Burkholderia multivorans]PRH00116.1 hypothetical protein C6T61_28440 [Burkholderia multivorans]
MTGTDTARENGHGADAPQAAQRSAHYTDAARAAATRSRACVPFTRRSWRAASGARPAARGERRGQRRHQP